MRKRDILNRATNLALQLEAAQAATERLAARVEELAPASQLVGQRLRLHLTTGLTIEGAVVSSTPDCLELQAAVALVADRGSTTKSDLDGTTVVPVASIAWSQKLIS